MALEPSRLSHPELPRVFELMAVLIKRMAQFPTPRQVHIVR
jgi:hypothetical protein